MSPGATFNSIIFVGAATASAVFAVLTLVFQLPWVIGNAALLVAIGVPLSFVSRRSAHARDALVAAISPSFPEKKYWPQDFGVISDRYLSLSSSSFETEFKSYRKWGLISAFFGAAPWSFSY